MGKTLLLRAWAEGLPAPTVSVASVACDELGQALPLQPLLDVVVALGAIARHRAGLACDPEEVEALLVRLDGLAGLEAWWLTAEAAASFAVPRSSDLAARRVRDLLAVAGLFE